MINKILLLRFILLLYLCCCLLPLYAQNRNTLVLRDSLTGKDSIIFRVSFVEDTPYNRQYGICAETGKLSLLKLTPTQVPLYRNGKQTYLSRTLHTQGTERQVLLPRILWQPSDFLSIFLFINDQKQKEYYYQFNNGKEVLPLAIATDGKTKSALEDYLLRFPVAHKDEQVQQYIRKMKPTPRSFKSRHLICRSGNINYLSKFRWGVLAGTGFSQLEMQKGYSSDKQWQWYAGAFADIPLGQWGISFHPELSFLKVSALQLLAQDFDYDLAYNRTALRIPLLMRYTVVSLRGKILPYLQFGPELDFRLKGDTDVYTYKTDAEGYVQPSEIVLEKNKNFLMSGTIGFGVEFRLQRNHSLFIDARYLKNLTSDTRSIKTNGWFVTASYNL